jgi:hypothetical protein
MVFFHCPFGTVPMVGPKQAANTVKKEEHLYMDEKRQLEIVCRRRMNFLLNNTTWDMGGTIKIAKRSMP